MLQQVNGEPGNSLCDEFNFGDVSLVLEDGETTWGRDRADGGDAAHGDCRLL